MLPDCDKAIVLLHEIYGINAHIQRSAATWRSRGFDAYTPALFPHSAPFAYEQQEQAWRHISDNVGFDTAAIVSLLAELRAKYGTLILIGYSVGATFTYKGNFSAGLSYNGYLGGASLDPRTNRLLTDRDYLSLTLKYAF